MVNALAAKFLTDGTNDIFGYDTAILGAEWGNVSMSGLASRLVPFNGEITILLSDIGQDNSDSGGIVGYFWAGNNFLPAYEAGSNGRIMFVIDAVMYANPNADRIFLHGRDRVGTDELLGRRSVFEPSPTNSST